MSPKKIRSTQERVRSGCSVERLLLLVSRRLAGGGDEEVGDLPDDVARGDQAQEGQVGARPVRLSNHPRLARSHRH